MWVNSKVVIDIESNEIISKEGYEYEGPCALATNVTYGYVVSDEGHLQNRQEITAATPTKEGIDNHSGGNGARLRMVRLSNSYILPLPNTPGSFGPKALTDGTPIFSYFAPKDWTHPQEGFDNTGITITPTRGQVSWAEFEVPNLPTRGRVSWAEFEVPTVPTRGRASWAEFEIPLVPTKGRVSWAEFEVPDLPATPTRGRVSWAEFEIPFSATRGRVSWAEFEVPNVGPVIVVPSPLLLQGVVYSLGQNLVYALPAKIIFIHYQGTQPEQSNDGLSWLPITNDSMIVSGFIRSTGTDTMVKLAAKGMV